MEMAAWKLVDYKEQAEATYECSEYYQMEQNAKIEEIDDIRDRELPF